jgi:hypothetical protein
MLKRLTRANDPLQMSYSNPEIFSHLVAQGFLGILSLCPCSLLLALTTSSLSASSFPH